MRAAFARAETGETVGVVSGVAQGITTGDNERFLRLWWEVARKKSEYDRHFDSAAPTNSWHAADKGGEFRRWFGNNYWMIYWPEDGRAVRQHRGSTARNLHTRFVTSISCSKISSGGISFRAHDCGFVFTDAAVAISGTAHLDAILGFTNSSTANRMFAALAPTLNIEVGQVRSLPWLVDSIGESILVSIIRQLKQNSADDWDAVETSWNFDRNPLLTVYRKTSELS